MKKLNIFQYCKQNNILPYYHKVVERMRLNKLSLDEALIDIRKDNRSKAKGSKSRIKYFVNYNGEELSLTDAAIKLIKQYDLYYNIHNVQATVYNRMKKKNETIQEAFDHVRQLYQKKFQNLRKE